MIGGIAPVAPINDLAMLHDDIGWKQRYIDLPGAQASVYGFGTLDLGREPVVVQVPIFGKRSWVDQATRPRTDGFADSAPCIGPSPASPLAGPDLGLQDTSRHCRKLPQFNQYRHYRAARVPGGRPRDNAALQPLLQQIMAYPLSEFDGTVKTKDWAHLPNFPWIKLNDDEWKWVDPATFFDVLPRSSMRAVLFPGEEGLYALVRSVLDAAGADRALRNALKEAAGEADEALVKPLLEFRNFGIPLPDHWTTVINSAEFGTDYYTRTAVAKSNTFINRPRETRYFYQDLDKKGARLSAPQRYTVTFAAAPPVEGFWSITLYDQHHFFAPNELDRFSLGTKSKGCASRRTARLSSAVQSAARATTRSRTGCRRLAEEFSLYLRAYWPLPPIGEGRWTPPAVVPVAAGSRLSRVDCRKSCPTSATPA